MQGRRVKGKWRCRRRPAPEPGRPWMAFGSEAGIPAILLPGTHEVAEAGEAALEGKLDRTDGPVALLSDNHLGLAVKLFHPLLPRGHFIELVLGRFLALGIIFLPEDEHDNVRVLFDGARFAQVRKLRALVLAGFHLARKL